MSEDSTAQVGPTRFAIDVMQSDVEKPHLMEKPHLFLHREQATSDAFERTKQFPSERFRRP